MGLDPAGSFLREPNPILMHFPRTTSSSTRPSTLPPSSSVKKSIWQHVSTFSSILFYFIVLCFLFLLLLRFFVVVVAVTKQNKRRTQLQNQSNERIRERERIRKRMEPSEMRKNCQHQQITDCTSTLDGSAGSGRKCRKSRMLNQVAYLIAYPSLER